METPAYLASAKDEGVDDDERAEIVRFLADNPSAGDLIVGAGGARKVRFAGRGHGKSGGYRVITFFAGDDIPLFLLDIYGKGNRANMTKAERNELRAILSELPKTWRAARVERMKRRHGK
ncbi:type II toxin-antitoxin system RelE/ParE family toxin [Mesorhizobium sp. J428]|uniref:type II toxin-antitoxin system RelE/ParE family toxin n=1 Tax=Mesorhizobium sp. J428 TaxID=2898440 RepID=UPI0027E22349|nr:type II toxin-antitoxin system RelE/ParE family toxin [Mesorhizobium sp. J428]